MKNACVILIAISAWSSLALGAEGDGVASTDGLLRFDPPQPLGCVAVRVDVPPDQMLVGLRWFNGSSGLPFPKILVASGSGLEPPAYSEALVVAEGVSGEDGGWSEVLFSTPVASVSGTLFAILQYPANYEPAPGGAKLGVGWAEQEEQLTHFVTGDGETWIKIASRCRVLVEPILAGLEPGVALKRGSRGGDLPTVLRQAGLVVAPNPFNPETQIDLYLNAATTGAVKILDVRGRLVTEVYRGAFAEGRNGFRWQGVDQSGNPVASGVYSVLAETSVDRYVKKVLLLK